MRIIFVRHGEPNYEKDCLTPLGRLQAQAAAQRLKNEGIETVYSSPFGRARETAQETARILGVGDVQILDFMHEIYWGSLDGTPLFANGHPWDIADEMARTGWDLARTDWKNHPLFQNNRATLEAERVAREIDQWMLTLGYSRQGAYFRCDQTHDRSRSVALFSHGGSSAAAIAHLLHLPFPYVCAIFHLDFTGITVLRFDWEEGRVSLPRLELNNDAAHIRGLSAE